MRRRKGGHCVPGEGREPGREEPPFPSGCRGGWDGEARAWVQIPETPIGSVASEIVPRASQGGSPPSIPMRSFLCASCFLLVLLTGNIRLARGDSKISLGGIKVRFKDCHDSLKSAVKDCSPGKLKLKDECSGVCRYKLESGPLSGYRVKTFMTYCGGCDDSSPEADSDDALDLDEMDDDEYGDDSFSPSNEVEDDMSGDDESDDGVEDD